MTPSLGNQSRNLSQNLLNGGRLQSLINGDLGKRTQKFSTRLSNQQWLFRYVQTVQNTLQTCQQQRELGVDTDVTDRIGGIVENTLRRDIPGLEPTKDEYLVEDISNAEGIQDALTVLRTLGVDIEREFDFDQRAADEMSRQAKKQSA